ncbi:MFS transporter [Phyllobacterium sp. 22229]|uniref:MFS transporter n=2 Tax=Pseudomonadota TaxID=1224 RepID=A0A2S9JHK9_9HYPH|nr:MFS transporter [Phyllobacterium myrsinacearum]PRD52466.1 MFS transporter [Phyllobacterium myrsinacearum]PWV92161.1 putative MFS family arabinose efflux permease [Phyllobacterium myrsinacearum]RZS77615.1 putative MFS family arabinose efflux permease [Phyllobacterium myrsinacearum]RZV05030.1 putative MFS family arabinose efflux permease [Phyllobacterium myrsinacearum]
MSAEIGVPSSTTHGRDVKGLHGHEDVNVGEIAIGVIIGRTSEFFDFFVYAIASVLVFPKLVFPYVDPLTGTLYSFAIFALAFIARPLGTVIFMAIDRTYGRGVKLTITLFLLGSSTVAIAFLPGYEQVGWVSALLLALFRLGQGLALGGEWDGLASLLALNAPERRRGWYAMIPQLGAPLGLMVAASLFAFFVSHLSAQDFLEWGWRYPFFVAFAINVVALFARLRMVVTEQYAELFKRRELQPTTVSDTLQTEGRHVVIGAFAPLASFALFHMVTVFPLSWVFLFTDQGPARFLMIETIGAAVGVIAIFASGNIADRVGRSRLLIATAIAIAVFSGFAPQLLDGGDIGEIIFMVFGFLLLGLSFGQSSGAVASNFSRRYRYTGSALTTDLAWLFGAGFAPLVALILSSRFGLIASGAYLLSGAACTLIALAVNRQIDGRDK